MKFESRTRLSLVLLLYFLAVVGVITLAPFRFAAHPDVSHVFVDGGSFDLVANVLLFLPLGFLYPLTRTAEDTSVVRVFMTGLVLSACIEATQAFEPERYCSLADVLTNATGAAVGALILRGVTRRIRVSARLVGRLSLEIPLVGLVYLTLPLLVVASIGAADDPARLVALIPLGFFCARLLSAVQRYHFGPAGAFRDRSMGAFAAGWTAVGTFPVMLHHPLLAAGLAIVVGLVTWFEASLPPVPGGERRFEIETLRSAAPYLGVYFGVRVFVPLLMDAGPWCAQLGLVGAGRNPDQEMARLLEPAVSLTLLGYLLAEARGRLERPFRAIVTRLAAECVMVSALAEGSRGFQPGLGASGVQLGLMTLAGLLGGMIYHRQRQHVRWILTHRPAATSPPPRRVRHAAYTPTPGSQRAVD